MRPTLMGGLVPGVDFALGVAIVLGIIATPLVWAGGSGLNVAVVANQDSSNSLALANYYCERRGIPPGNVVRINWTGGGTSWISDEFQSYLVTPLFQALASRQLTNQITHLVLSMDIPFQTISSADGTVNGTTSALFYGLRTNAAVWGFTNSYAASEAVFGQTLPVGAPSYPFLTTLITGDTLAHAEQVVDQGVNSDGTFPSQPVVLAKSSDTARNIRYMAFDNAIFNVNVLGISAILRTNTDVIPSQDQILGYETGLANLSVPNGVFAPGAVADSLTSFGGVIFGANTQTSLLAFTAAGATGSYGTVTEPGTDTQKFPDPQVYFYQSRGFNLAESYYQSIAVPYLGLIVGEPLAAPFQQQSIAKWGITNANPVLRGTQLLPLLFRANNSLHPLQQIDLFANGTYFNTVTNVGLGAGNVLTVFLNGYPVSYTVNAGATLSTVATGLAATLNSPAVSNITKIAAYPHGDRIELRATASNPLASPFFFTDAGATNAVLPSYRTVLLPTTFPPQMNAAGRDRSGFPMLDIETLPNMPVAILASTNLLNWSPICALPNGGPFFFDDPLAYAYPCRFYRISSPAGTSWLGAGMPPSTNPGVTALSGPGAGGALLQIEASAWPYIIESSTDGSHWTLLFTNLANGHVQMTTTASAGAANALTTFLTAAKPTFLDSSAYGMRQYKIPSSSPQVGAWIGFTITKTNSAVVVVGVTNQIAGASSTNLAAQLCNLINSNPALQGGDGVMVEDFSINGANTVSFNLRTRSTGLQASAVQVLPGRYGIIILPSTLGTLTQNLSDLQPRNHLYVTAGAQHCGPASCSIRLPWPMGIMN